MTDREPIPPIIATVDYKEGLAPRLMLHHLEDINKVGIAVDSETYAIALAEAINWVTARYYAGDIK